MIKRILIRILGKKLDSKLDKWGISKTKIVAVIGVLIYAVEQLSGPLFDRPIYISNDVYNFLGALGLWTLKDGQDDLAKGPTPPQQ